MSGRIEEQVALVVEPYILDLGMDLVDVEFVKEGVYWYLRIYIDKNGGVNLDDCSKVSQAIGVKIDEADPIKQAYLLEVSSPGLERPLKKDADFERFIGTLVTVHTLANYQGFSEFTGYLQGLIEQDIVLEFEGEKVSIPRSQVSKTHLTLVI